MVDVGDKPMTERCAVAEGWIIMGPEALTAVRERRARKGDVLAVAQLAGVQAAKRTSDLIPLCHPLPDTSCRVALEVDTALPGVRATAEARTSGRTGVEMEALTACSVAALTIYDMCKSMDKSMVIGDIALWEKTGGKSGTYRRSDAVD